MSAAILEDLVFLVKNCVRSRLDLLLPGLMVSVSDLLFEDLVPGHRMAFILVSNQDVKMFFQVFYKFSDAQNFASCALGKRSAVSAEGSDDFMREFCNLVAGAVRSTLEKSGVSSGISLPLSSRGFDNVFKSNSTRENFTRKQWHYQIDEFKFIFSVEIEVVGNLPAGLSNANLDSTGEIELF
jgi:hypothetical protein